MTPSPISNEMVSDMAEFGRELVESKDVDPLYDVLRELSCILHLDEDEALWLTELYLAFYNLPSGLKLFLEHPQPKLPAAYEIKPLPLAMERRNLRGGKVMRHLRSYLRAIEGIGQRRWITNGWRKGTPYFNYEAFFSTAQTLWGNGRWAAFKWSEILKKVHGLELSAPDMRLADCQAPRLGLEMVYGLKGAPIALLDEAGKDLKERLEVAFGYELDWETLETILCNYHSLVKGRYYVGHDTDELLAAIHHSDLTPPQKALLFDARYRALPHAYLGELGPGGARWTGIDGERKQAYRKGGLIYSRAKGTLGARRYG